MTSETYIDQTTTQERKSGTERRRTASRGIGKRVLATAGATLALVGVGNALRPSHADQERRAKEQVLVAKLMENATPTLNPSVVYEHYNVANTPMGGTLAEVGNNLHPLAKNQNGIEETQALETYLTPAEKTNTAFAPGVHEIAIDTERGVIIPKSEINNSVDPPQ